MRVTVSHNKGKQEAMRIVDGALDRILRPDLLFQIPMTDVARNWDGSTLHFSLVIRLAVNVPVRGTVAVTDTEITIECQLPVLLTQFIPEKTIESGVESKVRGLLR